MNISERHGRILQKLKETGKVTVQELSSELSVSEVTIRKDLRALEDKNLLFRTHGGATLSNPYTSDRHVDVKVKLNAEEKESIAREAIKLIGDNDSIILGSGTTILALARLLKPRKRINIITSAINVSLELSGRDLTEVTQLGGQLRPSSNSVVGPYAEQFMEGITCGVLFLGVDGVDLDYGFTTTNLMEASLNRKFIQISQYTVILADSSKFGKRGFSRICTFDEIQHIITDEGISDNIVKKLEEKGVRVTISSLN